MTSKTSLRRLSAKLEFHSLYPILAAMAACRDAETLAERSTGPERVYAFHCTDDCMEPTIRKRDLVFVDRHQNEPRGAHAGGGLYVLNEGGKDRLRRLQFDGARVRIIHDNQKYPVLERTIDQLRIVGVYLGRLTAF